MTKEIENIPGSVDVEMNFTTKSSSSESENFQTGDSYIPVTPLKPVQQKMRLSSEQRQENWLSEGFLFPNGSALAGEAYRASACFETSNSVDITNGFHNPEENLLGGSLVFGQNHISGEFSRFQQSHFRHLLALANAATPKDIESAAQLGNVNGKSGSTLIYKSSLDSNRFEASSATSSAAKQDASYESNPWSNNTSAPDINLYGNSTVTHPMYDLNSPPTASTDAFLSQSRPSPLAPITPDPSRKANCRNEFLSLSLNGKINQVQDKGGDEIATTRVEIEELLGKELQQLPKDLSSTVECTQLQENHNSDKTGNIEIDLNKTQQKPKRKKHRPKVVIEGKPKRTPKPVTPKPERLKENPKGKRKYVHKNRLSKAPHTPTAEVSSVNNDLKRAPVTEKSWKRALNFDIEGEVRGAYSESQAQNFSNRVELKSTVQLGEGIEIVLQKTGVGVAYDLNRSMNNVHEEYILAPERQSTSQIPNKTSLERNMVGNGSNDHSRGKCQIIFSAETHDKQGSNMTMMEKIENQSALSWENSLAEGSQARGLKRGNLQNVIGGHCNPQHDYLAMFPQNSYNGNGIPSMHFPTIYKKKRTEKIYCSTISTPVHSLSASQNGICIVPYPSRYTSQGVASHVDSQRKEQAIECGLNADQKGKMKKKRSKVPTRVHNFASLTGITECGQFPTFLTGAPIFGDMHKYGTSNQSSQSIEALVAETRATVKTKKRTKRLNFTTCTSNGVLKKRPSSIEEITELLGSLNINSERNQERKQQKRELVPLSFQFEDRNAIILYQRDGTLMPFEGAFDPVKKRKPRPKVDLDEETNRVWKLLLENINNEGIDGTDDEKTKWWDEERRVFQGRTDSFIARMHLVQGDRRFSPWKGSVLDSVVGVFLTQNVSDHLSSSAFMSLAARFPLDSKSSSSPFGEGTSTVSNEPEMCILDLDDTINWQGEKSNSIDRKEVDNNNESLGSCNKKSTGDGKSNILGIFGKGLQIDNRTISDREALELKEPTESSAGGREMDDAFSSQFSACSSKDSVDLPVTQTFKRTKTCFQENAEADPGPRSHSNNIVIPSFLEVLQMAESSNGHHDKIAYLSSHKENGFAIKEGTGCETTRVESFETLEAERTFSKNVRKCEEICTSEQSGVTAESASCVPVQENATKSNLESNHACTSAQVGVNMSKNVQIGHPKNNIQSERESTNVINITMSTEHKEVESSLRVINVKSTNGSKLKGKTGKQKESTVNWDYFREEAQAEGKRRERTANTMDSLDWEAVRCADVDEIADTIKERGMNFKLAERIKDFLKRLVEEHGNTDLEWLRDVPPDKAKEYLLSVRGLGLKSVECVRLLTLHHLAFPVDTNVGRIAVRLGWVPLQPLPESLQLHLLELYPVLESIQRYLWPRLCKLDQRTLYELHYQMITFGKVFCTKSKPNCNACPMRGECRHFASAFASTRLALPSPEEKIIASATENITYQNPVGTVQQLQLPLAQCNRQLQAQSHLHSVPIIEVPSTQDPIVEVPTTPVYEEPPQIPDIEDVICEDPDEIPTIKLNIQEFAQNLQNYMHQSMELQEDDVSKALIALTPEAASIPTPKLKNVSRLRTEHHVYELPDSHPLLQGLDKREPDDPCLYLLAIWTPGETANSITPPKGKCIAQEFGELCDNLTCFSCNSIREANSQIVRGTLLIPCRTAMRGNFPLNGTYFQVNEVFADHDSSINPIDVPRAWIWNLPRRTVYFGTSIPSIFKGLSTESIQYCFWRGFVCVRGFDQKSRGPRPLMARLHFPASKLTRTQTKPTNKQE